MNVFDGIPPRRRAVPALATMATILLLARLAAADFSRIEPLLQEHCVECHEAREPEGGLALDSREGILKGGESGPALTPGKGAESLLVKAIEGSWGKTGKNQFMPPGKRGKLDPDQIALFRAWIDAGAPALSSAAVPRELTVPRISPRTPPRRPIQALAFEPKSRLLAVARPDSVELVHVDSRSVVRTLSGFRGTANSVVVTADGQFVFAGAGDATGGEIVQWRLADGTRVRSLVGHPDAVYGLAVTADGQTLASGGYDYSIRLWNLADGSQRSVISVNQGAILGLAFRADGRILASAGFDRTAKLYASPLGTRLETFGQALKELNAVAFSPDGRTLLTGGGDNRIRAYRIGAEGREGSNELLAAVFAHEGAILRLAYSPDGRTVASSAEDRTVKLFTADPLHPRLTLEEQPDWPTALAFAGDGMLVVGRADGSLAFYETAKGKPAALPRPELTRAEPRGIQRGTSAVVRLQGRHLEQATVVRVHRGGRLWSVSAAEWVVGSIPLTLVPPADEPRGAWEISVGTGDNESGRISVWVDDLRQQVVAAADATRSTHLVSAEAPVSLWSTLEKPGTAATFAITVRQGQTWVFDLAAQRLGSKGDFSLELLDGAGRLVAANDSHAGQADPLLVFRAPSDGTYGVRIQEATFGGSADHYFRLSCGELPFITGLFPHNVPAGRESEMQLFGANLPGEGRVQMPAAEPGEHPLPEPAKSWRSRRDWTVGVSAAPTPLEKEPNDSPAQANPVPVPVVVNGQLGSASPMESTGSAPGNEATGDLDLFRFHARRGVTYVIETTASQRGSLADTRIAILRPDGKPLERVRLQAVRNSAITFRPETSDENGVRFDSWEEMELNDLLWCGGEVMKILRAPQGPDSDTLLYASNGRRTGFFDTTPMAHYLDQPVYLVTPLRSEEQPVANGLPVFSVPFENDDAARRDLGSDSRLHFTAPEDGEFLARVMDARGFGGAEYGYRLSLREAEPGFSVSLNGAPSTVMTGSGQGFSLSVARRDGFDGAVDIAVQHLPAGWRVSDPLRIEAGHDAARATVYADPGASPGTDAEWKAVSVVATARVEGRPVAMAVSSLGRPKLSTEVPKVRVRLEPLTESVRTNSATGLPVVSIVPGGTARARLAIERHGFEGVVTFSVDNLPHGVIVENLGLNGITFLADENEREISLAAVRWVADMDRPFHAVENQAGQQSSAPLLLEVRRPVLQAGGR
ncbi:MAG: hypothetical protein RIS76_3372 [Verrucomicrobiota bacterium]